MKLRDNVMERYNRVPMRRIRPGTQVEMECIQDIEVGATVVAVRGCPNAVMGVEYSVTDVNGQWISYRYKRDKYKMKPIDFMRTFERKLGPISESSLRIGLYVQANVDGKGYRCGDVFQLLEVGGSVFSVKFLNGATGNIERQEILACTSYVGGNDLVF